MFPIVGLCVETYGREAEEKKMIEWIILNYIASV
jgi:hypothetical protein